jgi:hypothetical protein
MKRRRGHSAAAKRRRTALRDGFVPGGPRMNTAARLDGSGPPSRLGAAGYVFVGNARVYGPSSEDLRIRECEHDYRPLRVETPKWESRYEI